MKYAIVGSRNYPKLLAVRLFVMTLPEGSIIVSGGAKGVDQEAQRAAEDRGLETIIFLPDWKTHGKAAGPIRNTQIVKEADIVVAFWDGRSTGTRDAVNQARMMGKEIKIFTLFE